MISLNLQSAYISAKQIMLELSAKTVGVINENLHMIHNIENTCTPIIIMMYVNVYC